jgi:chromosome segregation ATPase
MSLPNQNPPDNGTCSPGSTENILKAYLEMAESNLANGRILIDRIASLEKCIGCNEARKCKLGCDSCHAGVSPDVLQILIQRLTDEIPPQAELVSRIVDLLHVLRSGLEQQSRDISPQTGMPSNLEEIGLNDTGELDPSALLQLNFANIDSGEVLINRIAELESELHNLKAHSSGAPSGEGDCPRKLEEAQKQIQDLTFQIVDLNSELHALKEHPAEARNNDADCPERLRRAGSEIRTLLERIGTLESELHTLKTHSPTSPRGDKDCPKELEKAKKQLAELSAQLKTRKDEVKEHQADLDWYENFLEEHDEERDQAEDAKFQILKNQIAYLKSEVEKLKKEKLEVEKRLAECTKYYFETLEPLLEQRNDEIKSLKADINAKDHLENELDECHERNGEILAQLEAFWAGDTINADLERDHDAENQEYQALLIKVKVLKKQLKDCEKAQGNEVYDSDTELDIQDRSEEEQEDYMNFLESLTRQQLIEMLAGIVSYESQVARLTDLNNDLIAQNESRQRSWIAQAGVMNSKLNDAGNRYAEQNDVIASMKDDIRNLHSALTRCREFKADVLKLGIDEPEEPRDLEGLENEALIEEIIELQRKLKALGIKYKEAVLNEQTFESASELSEDLDMQNPLQELRELRSTLEELRATIKQVREENEERVDNPEDAESMTILKKGIQKLRVERDIAVENLKSSEEEVDRLIKTLQEQLDAREKDLQNEKERAKKQEENDAIKAKQVADLKKQLDDCLASREGLQEQFDAEWRKHVEALNEKKRADLEDLNEMIEEVKNSVRNEDNIEVDLEQDCEERIKALELQHTFAMVPLRRRIVELEYQLREAVETQPEFGPASVSIATATEEARLAQIWSLTEQKNHCEDEKKELKREITTLKGERARLMNQLQEQDDEDDNYQEGARRSTRNRPKRTQDEMNQYFEREPIDLPIQEDNFDGHNGACNDEIEELNNQITELKEKIEALEQQATLDKLEIDAMKHGNTDKSKAHQKFTALIEKLRTELADLQARLTDCKSLFPSLGRKS